MTNNQISTDWLAKIKQIDDSRKSIIAKLNEIGQVVPTDEECSSIGKDSVRLHEIQNYIKPYTTELVAYYPFYEDFLDHSGHSENNPYKIKNVEITTCDGFKCAKFNGTDSEIDAKSGSLTMNGESRNDLTICVWQKILAYDNHVWDIPFMKSSSDIGINDERIYGIIWYDGTYRGETNYTCSMNLYSNFSDGRIRISKQDFPEVNQWVFTALTCKKYIENGTSKIKLIGYRSRNNQLYCIGECSNLKFIADDESNPLFIGHDPNGGENHFNGYLREIRIYKGAMEMKTLEYIMNLTNTKG